MDADRSLEQRVARLEKRLETGQSVTDAEGNQWSFEDMIQLGLGRREAIIALGSIAAGYGIKEAITSAIAPAEAASADGSVGVAGDRPDAFLAVADVTTVDSTTIENDDYHETVVTQSGSTGSLDLSSANIFKQTITGNITFAFNNVSGSPAGNSFVLILQQDGTGGHTIDWPSSVEWSGGSSPGLSTNANDKHLVSFVTADGGSTWIGVATQNIS